MTKELYFEMCEMMGTEPDLSQVPVEYDDLSLDVQFAFSIYSKLKDEWDTMNGGYLGKNYSGIVDMLELLEVPREDRKWVFELINMIDTHRAKAIKDNTPKK